MADWIIQFIEQYGYAGIAALMFIENIFPPIPSELIMPFAGFLAAQGNLNPVLVVASGTAGSLLGALPWYFAGRALGLPRLLQLAERHGRWLTVSRDEVQRAESWFVERGPIVLVVGRLVPAVRSVIALPAGVAKLPLPAFCLWTAIGSALWCSALTAAGYLLNRQFDQVGRWMNPVSTGILITLVLTYVYRVARHRS
jgi:membrane protein DedA with SNARE-associated domain